jgi:uncharacterized protein VirK/YbjX
MLPRLFHGFSIDRARMSLPVACLRVLRTSPLLTMPEVRRALLTNVALRRHVESIAATDHFFYMSHRHYLAQGLTRRQRAMVALHHYEREMSTFDEAYFCRVYDEQGLTLWQEDVAGVEYELRLSPGTDVLYEGGLSVTMFVDGGRVAVLSFTYVERAVIFEDEHEVGSTMFVSRKQLASDHAYQRVFNAAFDRCSVGHVCMAAVAGIAEAQGIISIAAIRSEAQPGYDPAQGQRFAVAYTEFWESFAGQVRGRFAHDLRLPLQLRPLNELPAKARRRARRRRTHLEAIVEQATETIRAHMAPQVDRAASASG